MNKQIISKLVFVLLLVATTTGLFANGKKESVQEVKPLTVWVYDTGRIEVLTQIGKDFEAEYGVPVNVSLVDLGEIRSQMLLASTGQDAADIAIIPHDNLGALVENSAVLPVDLTSKENLYLEPALEGFKYNGLLYGAPLAVENIGFFRNLDLVPNAPETWDEMVALAHELIIAGKAEYLMGLPDAGYNVFPVYTSFGGTIFGKNDDGSLSPDKVEVANEGMIKGLEFLTNLVNQELTPRAVDWDGAHVLFETGKAPFIMSGPWALERFKASGVNYEVSAFPAAKKGETPGAPFLGVQGMVISSVTSQPLLAKAFVTEYIATEKNMKRIFDAEARPSAWKSIFESAGDKDSKGFNQAGVNAIPMPSIPAMGYVWDSWAQAAALAFSNERTPKEALENAKLQIDTQIKENK
jgi:arabinogalactan oligomer / maltooligosaccharide transport system substrate-binding protein